MTLLNSIIDLLNTRMLADRRTTLHKIRAHTKVRGNDLADAAAKLAERSFGTLPSNHTLRVDLGEIAPRPQLWIMHTATPPHFSVAPDTLTKPASHYRAWWTIPEAERLQMHAFTRPSQQLRNKLRQALLRSLRYSSLYRGLLAANKPKEARL